MNAHPTAGTLARTAYAAAAAPARSARSIEYAVFARITRALALAGEGAGGFPALAAALHDNLRLWGAIAADVAEPGNGLPAGLRAGLFRLAAFTRQHSSAVLAGRAGAEVLVEINTAVMRGLRGSAADAGPGADTGADGGLNIGAGAAAGAARGVTRGAGPADGAGPDAGKELGRHAGAAAGQPARRMT